MKKQMIQFMICSLLFTGCTATATQTGSSFQKNETAKDVISKAKTDEAANIKDKEMDTESAQEMLRKLWIIELFKFPMSITKFLIFSRRMNSHFL